MAWRIHALMEDADNADACFVELIKHGMSTDDQTPHMGTVFRGGPRSERSNSRHIRMFTSAR